MTKITCIVLIFFILVPMSSASELSTKMQGKLSLAFILLGIGILTKYMIHIEQNKVKKIHSRLGQPDRIIEYQKGFDRFRIEWYGEKQYKFRNGILIRQDLQD